ncbi:hypothetical protein M427DRAFT_98955 [Gonapodya prolifera JEL478]|uniref:CNH-domain-containing protein n=1 Tax=Gonapodya prolifera (strain JEL478) TaxID=1344416 RepID=A0A139AF19_GONPJ|nr:hypothetical protein M427DRAFT_98955 [Gonapodya prolifera JEL478]|eukprot:KXS15279.1 hypothetical protein M427DRAFT_98955 [Gonapodya prolifera JEL478]
MDFRTKQSVPSGPSVDPHAKRSSYAPAHPPVAIPPRTSTLSDPAHILPHTPSAIPAHLKPAPTDYGAPRGLTPRTASLRHPGARSASLRDFQKAQLPVPQGIVKARSATELPIPTSSPAPVPQLQPRVRKQLVYPAILSKVAVEFRATVHVGTNTRDNLEYADSFSGREAVDALCSIMRTTDRNLALLLGRALDAQKLFHDVLYLHRLRDNPAELYQFKESGVPRSTGLRGEGDDEGKGMSLTLGRGDGPVGVFTLLTTCYSPTCSRDRVCYSVACPRRLEQAIKVRLHRFWSGPTYSVRCFFLFALPNICKPRTWTSTIPADILPTVPADEVKRQEAIFELVLRIKEFVDDLEVVQAVYISGIRSGRAKVGQSKREQVIREIFLNVGMIYQTYSRLSRRLLARQKERPLVDRVGDVLQNAVPDLKHFVEYGSNQHYAKNALEVERERNTGFEAWLQECEDREPLCRNLPIQSFLARPTTHLGRLPLLIEAILKRTSDDHPDVVQLRAVVDAVKAYLVTVNARAGEADNKLKLEKLSQEVVFREGQWEDLKLGEAGRQLVRKGPLVVKRPAQEDVELTVFLFDHVVLLTKHKNGLYRVYRQALPLELIHLSPRTVPSYATSTDATVRRSFTLLQNDRSTPKSQTPAARSASDPFTFTINLMGDYPWSVVLQANSPADLDAWETAIEAQKKARVDKVKVFDVVPLGDGTFPATNRVNGSCSIKDGVVFATENGVWTAGKKTSGHNVCVVQAEKVTQVDVMEDYDMVFVLADKTLYTFPIDILDPSPEHPHSKNMKRGRKIATQINFFKAGVCNDRPLVCAVKTAIYQCAIKVLVPVVAEREKKSLLGGKEEWMEHTLRLWKEFTIPAECFSIHFLKTKVCVGCPRGFELVDLDDLSTQSLLDPRDDNLDFVRQNEGLRPLGIFRLHERGNFLLCYNEFGLIVDIYGRAVKKNAMLRWTGERIAFGYSAPYVIAFGVNVIEVHDITRGELKQSIAASNLRSLCQADLHYVSDALSGVAAGSQLVQKLTLPQSAVAVGPAASGSSATSAHARAGAGTGGNKMDASRLGSFDMAPVSVRRELQVAESSQGH